MPIIKWCSENQSFSDLVLSCISIIISVIALCKSVQVESRKNKLDLFDKRFNFYQIVGQFTNLCINGKKITTNDLLKFQSDIKAAQFCFSKRIYNIITEIEDCAWKIQTAQQQITIYGEDEKEDRQRQLAIISDTRALMKRANDDFHKEVSDKITIR